MSATNHGVFHAGMYAPSDAHKLAWQAWFSILSESYLNQRYASVELDYLVDDQAYTAANVIGAQTCGYPYIKRWADTHEPFAIPLFDVPGYTAGTGETNEAGQYSSWFITQASNTANSLQQFGDKRVAINSENSNSGMNVLRYAISQLTSTDTFFCERILTGGHKQSMTAIAEGRADLAAIDVVTYALINAIDPELCRQLKIVGQSEFTTGLPFISAKHSGLNLDDLCIAMNHAVEHMDPEARELLHLSGFSTASAGDYTKTKQLEDDAIAAGYPRLR